MILVYIQILAINPLAVTTYLGVGGLMLFNSMW